MSCEKDCFLNIYHCAHIQEYDCLKLFYLLLIR